MKKSLILLIIFSIGCSVFAYEGYYEQDYFNPNKVNVYNQNGQKNGYYEQDYFNNNRVNYSSY